LRVLLGRRVSLVVQDALAAMNPITTVEEQVGEVVRDHLGGSRTGIRERTIEMLRSLRLRQPETILPKHAHELSGGMQQRVVIAGALILGPSLLIADEPTTALDVTVQAQILELLRSIRASTGATILFVTHDLATVAEVCDRVLVMYAGQIIESGPIDDVYSSPIHPYTQALIAAIPPLGRVPPRRLRALGGAPPNAARWPTGCRFHPRCPLREALGSPEICATDEPTPRNVGAQWATCHFADESRSGTTVEGLAPDPSRPIAGAVG
jgi:peptide/nickel transport system ATP-binding protein